MGKAFESKAMLIVDPADELVLEGPFNRAVCKKILVLNPSKQTRVAFKLKTTTPRLFFVRPNVGVVKPEETIPIDIFVHPIYQDNNANRHKFLMQAAEVTHDVSDLHEFWKHVAPSDIWDTKIKVKLLYNKGEGEQNSGDVTTELNEAIGEHQDKDNNDPLAKLLNQVNELEEERQRLALKVETITKEKEEQTKTMNMKSRREMGRGYFFFMITVIIVLAAFAGAYFGVNFM